MIKKQIKQNVIKNITSTGSRKQPERSERYLKPDLNAHDSALGTCSLLLQFTFQGQDQGRV